MRAWQVVRYGEPDDVLTLADVAEPAPGPGQVLVRGSSPPGQRSVA
ncbi:hypothetical protein [Cellulomonas sp. Leaf395]